MGFWLDAWNKVCGKVFICLVKVAKWAAEDVGDIKHHTE